MTQSVGIDIHHPVVNHITRNKIEGIPPYLVLTLGKGHFGNGAVKVFVDDAEWTAIVAQVEKFLAGENA